MSIFHKVNAVLKSRVNDGFPFSGQRALNIQSGQPVGISMTDIFNKFRDNDVVIEKYLSNFTSSNYQVDWSKIRQINAENTDISSRTQYADLYQTAMQNHLRTHHVNNSTVAQIGILCVGTDCEDICEPTTPTNSSYFTCIKNNAISNDFVDRAYTEQDYPGMITATLSGYLTDYRESDTPLVPEAYGKPIPNIDGIPYIFRKWRSGIGELDISLPTSFNLYGKGHTLTTLKLNNGFFRFQEIYSAVAQQNSPPLMVDDGNMFNG